MEKVLVEMECPKESKEIVDCLASIVRHFMDKKPLAEAAALLPELMVAIDGWDKVAEEMGADSGMRDEMASYLVLKLMRSFGV